MGKVAKMKRRVKRKRMRRRIRLLMRRAPSKTSQRLERDVAKIHFYGRAVFFKAILLLF